MADPQNSRSAFQLASQLSKEGRFAEAEDILRRAAAIDPKNADLWNARGVMFANLGRHLDAVWCYRDGLSRNSNAPGIWTNLGNALTHLRQLKSAVVCHQRAIQLSAPDPMLFHNLGLSLAQDNRHGEAVAAFTRALAVNPDCNMARWDRARSYLALGNYKEGFVDYEVRLVTGQLPARKFSAAQWKGEPYAGKRLLVVVEQGLGDTIWAVRYLPQVKALGGTLIVECQPELVSMIAYMQVADEVRPRGANPVDSDFYVYWCSLPGLFTSGFSSIPQDPYIFASRERLVKLKPFFEPSARLLKIGIVWSGSVTFKSNNQRAQTLIPFLRACVIPGVQVYSLQKGPRRAHLQALPSGNPVVDLASTLDDFGDTAAAVAQLDLVIMTDSSVAHLAGAMGKPVWLLLNHTPHWLWMLDRSDSPWYRSMRLFRARAPNDWDHVFDSVLVELMSLRK
jgi:Flp pilus assembly protein TadD